MDDINRIEGSLNTTRVDGAEIGYPVQVKFLELNKMYMKRISWEWHPEIEVLIVNYGDVRFMTNDRSEIIHAGQGVIINSNTMHSIEPEGKDVNCSMYSTVFHPAFLFGHGESMLEDKYLSPIVGNKSFQYQLLDEENRDEEKLLECINEVIAANLMKRFGYELYTKSRLYNFWIELLNIVKPKTVPKRVIKNTSADEKRSKDIITYMEEHYAEKITLDDIAKYVDLSRSECCRCFKRALGITPVEYLLKYRIKQAAFMIKEGDERASSFQTLSINCGFNNASYFNKVFKEYLGCTPSQYKRKINSELAVDPFRQI